MLLFLGVLGWLIGGPVKKALADRARPDSGGRRRGTRAPRESRSARERHPGAARRRSRTRSAAFSERAQVEGERQKRELIAAAEAEAQKILQSARNEVDNRLKHARHELTEYAGELATQRAEQILREKDDRPGSRAALRRERLGEVERRRAHDSARFAGRTRAPSWTSLQVAAKKRPRFATS